MFTVKPVPKLGLGRQTAQRVLNIEKRDKYRAAKAKIIAVIKREDLQQITGFKFRYKDGKSVNITILSTQA